MKLSSWTTVSAVRFATLLVLALTYLLGGSDYRNKHDLGTEEGTRGCRYTVRGRLISNCLPVVPKRLQLHYYCR